METNSFFFPAARLHRRLSIVPRGSGSAVFFLPRDRARTLFKYCSARVVFAFLPLVSFRAKPRNLVETNFFFFPATECVYYSGIPPRGLSSAVVFVNFAFAAENLNYNKKYGAKN